MSYANSADPDQTPPVAGSELSLQCLPLSYTVFIRR